MHGWGTPQSASQTISMLAYVRKKALSPGKRIECTCALVMGKSSDIQFGIQISTWNMGSMLGR